MKKTNKKNQQETNKDVVSQADNTSSDNDADKTGTDTNSDSTQSEEPEEKVQEVNLINQKGKLILTEPALTRILIKLKDKIF